MDKKVFTPTERIVYALRSLYKRYGYTPYQMGKFEEYDLYSRNKDFLISDSVITFTDTNGKLKALKPDVTLSIIKNNRALNGRTEKLYYNENVYRVSKGVGTFKEIMQAGIECIGDVDSFAVGECLYLAAKSLLEIKEDFVLTVSSLDILLGFVGSVTEDRAVQDEIIRCVSEKNLHEIHTICEKNGIDVERAQPLEELVSIYGKICDVIDRIALLCERQGVVEPMDDLRRALSIFGGSPLSEKVVIDFSVVSDRNYYNGIIFKGFVEGVPGSVLSGGQYDKLMRRMHRRSNAVGFAVYLDMLERVDEEYDPYDVDVLLLYDEDTDPARLRDEMERCINQGESVRSLKADDKKLRYRRLINYHSRRDTDE